MIKYEFRVLQTFTEVAAFRKILSQLFYMHGDFVVWLNTTKVSDGIRSVKNITKICGGCILLDKRQLGQVAHSPLTITSSSCCKYTHIDCCSTTRI